jgi:hypothetical protein
MLTSWEYGRWSADHALPLGASERVGVGDHVNAGDVLAAGSVLGTAVRTSGARRLGLDVGDLERVLRVPVGMEVASGTVIARTGRRFARAVSAPLDGRFLQVGADGDLYFAPVLGRWVVRGTLDGTVTRSDDATVTVNGDAWCLGAVAAYGPDAVGELTLGVESPDDELAPARVDVRLGGRIMVGGARVSAEAITRAHACGVTGLVAGAANAAGLRVVYGEAVTAAGAPGREDRPTVLCLVGSGVARLPPAIFDPLVALAGSRAAIHTASARLFVFASPDATEIPTEMPTLVLAGDYSAVRAFAGSCEPAAVHEFASEMVAPALQCGADIVPAANVRAFGGER